MQSGCRVDAEWRIDAAWESGENPPQNAMGVDVMGGDEMQEDTGHARIRWVIVTDISFCSALLYRLFCWGHTMYAIYTMGDCNRTAKRFVSSALFAAAEPFQLNNFVSISHKFNMRRRSENEVKTKCRTKRSVWWLSNGTRSDAVWSLSVRRLWWERLPPKKMLLVAWHVIGSVLVLVRELHEDHRGLAARESLVTLHRHFRIEGDSFFAETNTFQMPNWNVRAETFNCKAIRR